MPAQQSPPGRVNPDGWLSVADVAEQLNVKEDTLRSWMRRGKGPHHYKLGVNLIRLRQADVDAWMESRRA